MKTSLKGQTLTYENLWKSMEIILECFINSINREIFMQEALDTLIDLFGADRGVILTTDINEGENFIVCARGRNHSIDIEKQEEISRTIIKKAQLTGKLVVFHPDDDNDFSESMKMCSIYSALAIPLYTLSFNSFKESHNEVRGVLYLDFRSFSTIVTDKHIDFFKVAAHLISTVIEQRFQLEVAKQNLEKLKSAENSIITLDEIMAPKSMERIRKIIEPALTGKMPILITGESGTGKTIIAKAIARAAGVSPIVRATLGFSEDLNTIASELFGHLKGAYSGAVSNRKGLVEQADKGVIILDEILNLPLKAQQLLLDFTQFGTYRPLGWDKKEPKHSNVRVISVTNGDLENAISEKKFRMDLFYRIAAVRIHIPPLRERREDIPGLVLGYLRRLDNSISWSLDIELRSLLVSSGLDWPGNIRQLEAMIGMARERALLENPVGTVLTVKHFLGDIIPEITSPPPISEFAFPDISDDNIHETALWLKDKKEKLELFEKELIEKTLSKYNGTIAYAARALDIPRTSLLSRMNTLKIERPRKP